MGYGHLRPAHALADFLGGRVLEADRPPLAGSDINRVWAPMHPATTRIRYFAPSTRVVRRLIAYGVPRERITLTGFPLPHELVGGHSLAAAKANLLRRLARLDVEGIFRRRFGDEVERTLGPLPAADGPPR